MTESEEALSRVRAALTAAGHPDSIQAFPAGTHTAAEAAAAIGCAPGQIAKSIIFRADETPVLVIASGPNRISRAQVSAALGRPVGRADADFLARRTGFAPGGVAPVGHLTPPLALLDEDLLAYETVWAAAGTPSHVFRTTPADLLRLADARATPVKE